MGLQDCQVSCGTERAMTINSPETTKKQKRGWNPFQELQNEPDALSATKLGGFVSGYLALSYLIQITIVVTSDEDPFGDAGFSLFFVDIFGVMLAIFLTWRIVAAQSFWAIILTSVWLYAEILMKIIAIASGEYQTSGGWVVMYLALLGGTFLAIRGGLKLRVLRRLSSMSLK